MEDWQGIEEIKEDLENIRNNFLYMVIERLSSIKRYNTRKFIIPQNVLEHEGSVTLISMLFSDYFNKIGIKNDTEKVLRMAILHDTDEIISGDIPHDAKYDYTNNSEKVREALAFIEKETINNILNEIKRYGLFEKYHNYFNEIKEKKSIEAKIVKLADFVDVMIYTKIENLLGNSTIISELNNSTNNYNKLLNKIFNGE